MHHIYVYDVYLTGAPSSSGAAAEASIDDFSEASVEVVSLLRAEAAAMTQYRREVATLTVERLSALLHASPSSIHTDTEAIIEQIINLVDVKDGAVFALVVQLQLRAEEIQAWNKKLADMRQRVVKLTGSGQILEVEALLVEVLVCTTPYIPHRSAVCFDRVGWHGLAAQVAAAPEEWRVTLEHERSRLRAYYIAASQDVAQSLLLIVDRNGTGPFQQL
jgi:hypothetical protein